MTTANLSDHARAKLRDELEVLRAQRRAVGDGLDDVDASGDRMDDAELLRRHDEIAMLDDRIRELVRVLAGAPLPGSDQSGDGLVPGTTVKLRHDDGSVETLRTVAVTEEIAPGEEDAVLTVESPLGQALGGHKKGDRVSFDVPDGTMRVEIVDLKRPE